MSSPLSFEVRPAGRSDAQAIADIHSTVQKAAYKGLLPEAHFQSPTASRRLKYWQEAIEFSEPQVHVAIDEDRIVGFIGFDRSRDEGTPPTTGEIWAAYVLPSHWSTGAGLALWDAAREGLLEEGCTLVTVWLPLANERAMRFFELAGFKREMSTARTVPVGEVKIEEIRLKRPLS
ncbi:MAG: GNAT family N-acetyltransferase [Burkholderiaceae bacterium]|nr:GNAT family N-acetyltransferase [Burkholderiaceae bacterium]MDO9089785.1 GNAT family N-acetyltransferase [Burkholderiaceae bacterium]